VKRPAQQIGLSGSSGKGAGCAGEEGSLLMKNGFKGSKNSG
jgi:hypothetical protein